jgi:type I restriction enzyme S subunit
MGGRKRLSLSSCLVEVTHGIGCNDREHPLLGATRAGLAPAKEGFGKSPERYKLVDRGTIFYNPMRILLGSIAMVDERDEVGVTSPDYVVFKTTQGLLDSRWFYFWLRSREGETFIRSLARGAVRERMLFRRLASAEVDLPTWEAQIAASQKLKLLAKLQGRLLE